MLWGFFSGSLCLQSSAKPQGLQLSEQNPLAGWCRTGHRDKIVQRQSVRDNICEQGAPATLIAALPAS